MDQLKLKINDEFYKPEERCGYLVPQKLKKVWAVELDLLNELLRVTNKYGIKVVVFAGTLLGAIRHKGFIPWDDDIDVAMDRENYEKLLNIASKEFKEPYFFQNIYTDSEYFIGYSRLRNSSTTGAVTWNMSTNYNNGIYIDVFVLDGLTDDKKLLEKQVTKRDKLESIIRSYNEDYSKKTSLKSKIGRLFQCTIDKVISQSYWINKYNKCLSENTKASDKLTLFTHTQNFLEKYWIYKKDLDEIIFVEYEGIEVPIPRNYDQVLKNIYGNYMEFPPVEERGQWHNNVIEFEPDVPYKEYIGRKLRNETK